MLGGIVGNLSGSSTGHLIDIDAGPQQAGGGQVLDILAAPGSGDHSTLAINAVDVGANGPHLADLGVLTGDGLLSGAGAGGGADSLVGNVLGAGSLGGGSLLGGSAPAGNDAGAGATAGVIDTGLVHDLLSSTQTSDHGVLDLHGVHII